jgi:hypothetical protein
MLERLLEPGSTELPVCVCRTGMLLARTEASHVDTEIRIFQCPNCQHELRLTVWRELSSQSS